jgi:RNA polymerase sigma factor (sigma-70 family)
MLCSAQAGGLSDAALLERFVAERDEAAFEVLVWRHGPKVLNLCRRLLRQEQDAEDAFQAAFLVLARKAGSIGKRQALAGWLYRVAYRVALRAKGSALRRRERPADLTEFPAAARIPNADWADVRPVLDEELSRLPEKYRAAFMLCYLEGKTNAEAARELGCPQGTILSRLAWARQRLRARLTRRGLTLSAGILAAAQAQNAPAAVLPAALVAATLDAAVRIAAGGTVTGLVSTEVITLTHGGLHTMLSTKLKIAAGCALAAGALGIGGVWTRPMIGPAVTAGRAAKLPEAPPTRTASSPDKPETDWDKKYSFEMREVPWTRVLEWLSDQSDLPLSLSEKPAGTFTFMSPKKGAQYTLLQIIDIMNDALQQQHELLVRRSRSFTLIPTDKKIEPDLLRRIRPEDLAKQGQTELVSLTVPLKNLKAEDIVADVKKMLGPFGEVKFLETSNQLILQDAAGNLRRVYEVVQEVEKQRRGR